MKRCTDRLTDRQTDRQKQTDHNNPLLSSSVNDNYCTKDLAVMARSVEGEYPQIETLKTDIVQINVQFSVVTHAPFATKTRQPQKKGLSPLLKKKDIIKSVNCVSAVIQYVPAPLVPVSIVLFMLL